MQWFFLFQLFHFGTPGVSSLVFLLRRQMWDSLANQDGGISDSS